MIKIKAAERKIGFNKTGKTLWYPAIHLHSDVKFEEFIELVADETTVSSADIKAVFDRSAKVLIRLLQGGKSVDCGDMGTFRPSITAKAGMGVDKAEKVGVELVDKAKVIYTPRVKVKTALKGVPSTWPASLRRRRKRTPSRAGERRLPLRMAGT